MEKFILSYSCGKDSTLSLYRLIEKGYIPVGLIVTVNKNEDKSWFHGIPSDILNKVSESLSIPLIKVNCIGEEYEKAFEEALNKGMIFSIFTTRICTCFFYFFHKRMS